MPIDVRLYAPIATGIGICVSIFLWILNQRRKELRYEIVKRQEVLALKGEARKHLQVLFDKTPVEDIHILVLKLINTGHLTINPSDYQSKLSVQTGAGSKILMATVIESQPADLDERKASEAEQSSLIESVKENCLYFRPVMLNQGDSFTLQLILQSPGPKVTIGGHIQGIPVIKAVESRQILPLVLTQVGAITMAFSMLLVDPRDLYPLQLGDVIPYALFFLLGYVLLTAGINLPKNAEVSGGLR